MNTQRKASKWHNKPSKTFGTAVCLELEMHTQLVLYQIFSCEKREYTKCSDSLPGPWFFPLPTCLQVPTTASKQTI